MTEAAQATAPIAEATIAPTSSTQGTSAPAIEAAPVVTDWTSTLAKEEADYVKNKGWKEPKAILNSYKELEKFRGADEKSILKIPSKDAKPEELDAFYNKLGRPESADKYELAAPEGVQTNPDMVSWFKEEAYKNGLPADKAKALFEGYLGIEQKLVTQYNEARKAEHEKQLELLKSEWGADYAANEEYARRGGLQLGLTTEDMNEIGDKIGTAKLYKMLSKAGEVSGEIKRPDAGSDMSSSADQQAALKEIQELSTNKEFAKKLNYDKDAETIKKWAELHARDYPNK
jgi:hypothetical protein